METFDRHDIGGIHHQRVKVQHGADGSATDVSSASPLPVDVIAALPAGTNTIGKLERLHVAAKVGGGEVAELDIGVLVGDETVHRDIERLLGLAGLLVLVDRQPDSPPLAVSAEVAGEAAQEQAAVDAVLRRLDGRDLRLALHQQPRPVMQRNDRHDAKPLRTNSSGRSFHGDPSPTDPSGLPVSSLRTNLWMPPGR